MRNITSIDSKSVLYCKLLNTCTVLTLPESFKHSHESCWFPKAYPTLNMSRASTTAIAKKPTCLEQCTVLTYYLSRYMTIQTITLDNAVHCWVYK